MGSSDVSAGDTILASQQNDLRDDVIDLFTTSGEIFVGTGADAGGVQTAMSQAVAEAGTEEVVRGVTALRIKQAIDALGSSQLSSTIVSNTRTAGAGSGDQSTTGAGFQPTALIIICTSSSDPVHEGSWGFGDDAQAEALMFLRGTPIRSSMSGQIIHVSADGSNGMSAVLKTLDADGFTLTWTKAGTPTGTAEYQVLCLR